MKRLVPLSALFLVLAAGVARADEPTSCVACHTSTDWFSESQVDETRGYLTGVHAEAGLSCHDCHGGNPDPALADDLDAAMSEGFTPNPYLGVLMPADVPSFCGSCHSNIDYMRRFHPDPRVDQEREYWTSHHGQRLREGDTKVATCVSCHGAHGVLRVSAPDAPVYPTHVADTCGGCHSDATRMAGYTRDDGRALPVDQLGRWQRSVHAAAMFEKEDLSAPTCNDCHGNHGAAPPGLDSVTYVCGQCHGREAELFRESPKAAGFHEHNDFLDEVAGEGCSACHDFDASPPWVGEIASFTECAICHGNHAVVRPTIAMLGPLPETPCAFCHEQRGPLDEIPSSRKVYRHYIEVRDALLEDSALQGEALFNDLVDEALALEWHTEPGEGVGTAARALRPEFSRLFRKFRIGRTTFEYTGPDGELVVDQIRRCDDCHGVDPAFEGSDAWRDGTRILEAMHELTMTTARAQRTLLAARRGGVETREAATGVDQAVDNEIELQVLVHTFDVAEDSEFQKKHAEGMEHAREAQAAADAAIDELRFRRGGLAVSLGIIGLVLVFLALKIRRL